MRIRAQSLEALEEPDTLHAPPPPPYRDLIRATALATRLVLLAHASDAYDSWNGGCCRQICILCREALLQHGVRSSIKLATLISPEQDPIEHAVLEIGNDLIDCTPDPPAVLDPQAPFLASIVDMPDFDPDASEYFTKLPYRDFIARVLATHLKAAATRSTSNA